MNNLTPSTKLSKNFKFLISFNSVSFALENTIPISHDDYAFLLSLVPIYPSSKALGFTILRHDNLRSRTLKSS